MEGLECTRLFHYPERKHMPISRFSCSHAPKYPPPFLPTPQLPCCGDGAPSEQRPMPSATSASNNLLFRPYLPLNSRIVLVASWAGPMHTRMVAGSRPYAARRAALCNT